MQLFYYKYTKKNLKKIFLLKKGIFYILIRLIYVNKKLASLRGGDKLTKEELGQLILSSEQQLYATAKTILKNDQDCADAIQESIVKAFSKIHTLKKDRYAKTWLIRILINECYNIVRQDGMKNQLDEKHMDIINQQEEKRDYSKLYSAVNELKEELRIPVVLYYMEDFSVREIAQILEISEGAVQKRLARARGKLKKRIELKEIYA